jgi:hypothetical protein
MKPASRGYHYVLIWGGCAAITATAFILHEFSATGAWVMARPVAEITRALLFFLPSSCLVLPVGIALSLSPKHRVWGLTLIAGAVGLLSGMMFSSSTALKIRLQSFEQLALRSRPLTDAIRKYESIYSRPPASLTDLVPDLIPTIPSTGMSLYPKFRYTSFATNQPQYGSNLWFLEVFAPRMGINFDKFLYFPNGQYPERGFGGYLERIEDWAYVHE